MVIQYGPESLVTPFIALPDYIDMVLMWLLIFGLAFQLPLVTMAIVRVGVVEVQSLARLRRYVYMGLAIVSAMLMPDLFSGTLALMVPLCLLYEFGLLLARMRPKKADQP
jgi:sec-independent protein translocase protein TatC